MIEWFTEAFEWLTATHAGKLIATFFISMLPVVELRGGLPYGVLLGLGPMEAYITAVLGNMLPIPFVLLFINKILSWLHGRDNIFGSLADWLETKALNNSEKVLKYETLGLLILVAIPLPGTGAWTGALVAAFMGIKNKKAFPTIFAGVLLAGIIMLLFSQAIKTAVG